MKIYVFEGIKGSGKTTLIKHVVRKLTSFAIIGEPERKLLSLREPGATPLGETLREYMRVNPDVSEQAKTYMFLAARAETIDKFLVPLLGVLPEPIVLLDRWTESTLAYNGPHYAQQAHAVVGEVFPWSNPFTFFLNTTPETCLLRREERTKEKDLVVNTAESLAYERYTRRFGSELGWTNRFIRVLDSENLTAEEVAEQVATKIMEDITWH